MSPGNDQDVRRGLRIDVAKRRSLDRPHKTLFAGIAPLMILQNRAIHLEHLFNVSVSSLDGGERGGRLGVSGAFLCADGDEFPGCAC